MSIEKIGTLSYNTEYISKNFLDGEISRLQFEYTNNVSKFELNNSIITNPEFFDIFKKQVEKEYIDEKIMDWFKREQITFDRKDEDLVKDCQLNIDKSINNIKFISAQIEFYNKLLLQLPTK